METPKINLWPGNGKYCGLFNIDFDIKPNDKVLDIGAGHKPHPSSTHVCDLVDENQQRHNRPLNIGDREFINGFAEEALKQFPDDYFDFCYTNHTLEHIVDLAGALKEIGRVCKRGFNAFPASDFEFMTAKSHFGHCNLIRVINGEIHFTKRPENTITDKFGYLFESKLFNDAQFRDLWEGHEVRGLRFIWEARHYWEDSIEFKEYKGNDAYLLFPQLEFFG